MSESFLTPKSRYAQALYSGGIAAAMVCTIIVFAPFALYSGNPDEFSVSLPAIFMVYAVPGTLFVLLLSAIGWLIPAGGFPGTSRFWPHSRS